MSVSNVKNKDPNATLDFKFNWDGWLSTGETIIGQVITTASGITSASTSIIASACVVTWLIGGTSGHRYDVACKITTSASRIDERTMRIDVKNR